MSNKRKLIKVSVIFILSIFGFSLQSQLICQTDKSNQIKIGSEIWMSENLNVDKFKNGDPVPQAKTNEEWLNAGENQKPVWCYYENKEANGAKFGKLYNWFAINDKRGLAPEGWLIPKITDWEKLIQESEVETFPGKVLKSKEYWIEDGNGTNENGFNAFPGGQRETSGNFSGFGEFGFWWVCEEDNSVAAWLFTMNYGSPSVSQSTSDKGVGFSVRCIKKD